MLMKFDGEGSDVWEVKRGSKLKKLQEKQQNIQQRRLRFNLYRLLYIIFFDRCF